MKKITLLLASILFAAGTTFAQDIDARKAAEEADKKIDQDVSGIPLGWTKSGSIGINLSETGHKYWYTNPSDNLLFALNGTGTFKAYHRKGNVLWLNDFLLGYGVVSGDVTTDGDIRKNDDRLLFSTTYAPRILGKDLYLAFNGDLSTQISKSFDYAGGKDPVSKKYQVASNFFTPGYIRLGVGILWKPNTKFRLYFSPLTANIIGKMDKEFLDRNAFGVAAGKTINFGLGALLRADYQTMFAKNISYKTRLDLFTNYLDKPIAKIDVDWLNTLGFNLTKYIGVNFNLNVRYHEDEKAEVSQNVYGPRTQYINNLGVGFNYKF
jgi:Protein of unknown function (DUF3078)